MARAVPAELCGRGAAIPVAPLKGTRLLVPSPWPGSVPWDFSIPPQKIAKLDFCISTAPCVLQVAGCCREPLYPSTSTSPVGTTLRLHAPFSPPVLPVGLPGFFPESTLKSHLGGGCASLGSAWLRERSPAQAKIVLLSHALAAGFEAGTPLQGS